MAANGIPDHQLDCRQTVQVLSCLKGLEDIKLADGFHIATLFIQHRSAGYMREQHLDGGRHAFLCGMESDRVGFDDLSDGCANF
ncbi:MAG: hypothetical protein H8K05_21325 [Nitrospira sp.]|nr:hypothetical protein [Nitrospira sp.]MCS6320262.1 hypothetical protein [Nitrospira sp.]